MGKTKYDVYKKFDVVLANFGDNNPGVEAGLRPGVIISCNQSNHSGAPQVCVVPLSTKLKKIPVHVILNPMDVRGRKLSYKSDFIPECTQTLAKSSIKNRTGYIPRNSEIREKIDRALIAHFDLLDVARKMIEEEAHNEQIN